MAHRSRSIGAGAIALATGMLIALPTFSSGAAVENDLRSFESAQTREGPADPPNIKPPLHGTNPHGQGTAAVVDISPNRARPFVVDERGNAADEDIIIGRSRGERRADGTYRGHITVAAAFGSELIARTTAPGERIGTAAEPVGIADDLLDDLCDGTGICLGLAEVYSETTNTGSLNRFTLASATVRAAAGVPALSIGAAESRGDITTSPDGNCQTATGGSRVANVQAGAAPLVEVAQSASESIACRGGGSTQRNSSSVADLNGDPLPLLNADCANNVADTELLDLLGVLTIICNADDSSATTPAGNQASAPYGVRNALDVYVLTLLGTPLSQVSAAQSESRAVAPAAVTATTPTTTTPAPTATTPAPTATTPAPTATTPAPVPTPTPGTADDGGADAGDDDASGNEGAGDDGGAGDGTPECSDGVDNDGDGKIDFGSDPGCSSAEDDSEANAVSLAGNELPFTGTDVVVLGLAGSILLAAGLTLRGPARRRELDS